MKKLNFVERQSFWQEPDCYDGKSCDKLRPRWMTEYPKEGKEEDGEILKLEIDAKSMPPGSRITIEVPCCPKCGDPADMSVDYCAKHKEWPNCRCGFSWKKWTYDNYC